MALHESDGRNVDVKYCMIIYVPIPERGDNGMSVKMM